MTRLARCLVLVSAAAGLFFASGGTGMACWCDWFGCGKCGGGCGGCGSQVTTYRPLFGGLFGHRNCGYDSCNTCAPTCCPQPCCQQQCCQPQTCQYVPQTCCRTECVNVPVTTYRPCTSCDPCTGCPTTVLRPVTTYVRQVRQVPVTTYRLVMSPAAGCSTCASPATSYYAPSYAPSSGCATCGAAPVTSYSIQPGATVVAPEAAPALQGGASVTVPQTYLEGTTTRRRVVPQPPIPDAGDRQPAFDNTAELERPRPVLRSASMPIHRPAARPTAIQRTEADPLVIPAQHVQPVKAIDDGGWRSARE